MPWFRADERRWTLEILLARALLANCRSNEDEGVASIEGDLAIVSISGYPLDTVRIRVTYPDSFPNDGKPPTVYLISHRDVWQNIADSHINFDWSLCLFVPAECEIDFTRDKSVEKLLAVVRIFLFKEMQYQAAFKEQAETGKRAAWLGPARAHYLPGQLEAARDNPSLWDRRCPCSSGKSFRHCHLQHSI